MRVVHCTGTPGSEQGATYIPTALHRGRAWGLAPRFRFQARAQATGYQTCPWHGTRGLRGGSRVRPWAAARPQVLDLVSGPHRLSFAGVTTLRLSNQPGRWPEQPGQDHARARPMIWGVTPSHWKPAVHSAPRGGAGGALSQVWPWAACVARGHDSELQATCSGASRRPCLPELEAGPEVCTGVGLWGCPRVSCPVQGLAGRQEGWGGEQEGTGSGSNSRICFSCSGRKTGRPRLSRGAEGPPGRRALPEGDTWAVGNELVLGLASGHRHRGFLPSRGRRADHRSKSQAQEYPCPLRPGPLGKGSSAAVGT